MELKERRKVRVTETLEIQRPTVNGLMETFQQAFRGKNKPVRVLYSKGEDLLVERSVVIEQGESEESSLLTPYQMVRQHADLEIQESIDNSIVACCVAAQSLRKTGAPLTFIVTSNMAALREWLPDGIDLSEIFGVEVFIDTDTPESCIFMCGSVISPMIRDIEKAICCRMV